MKNLLVPGLRTAPASPTPFLSLLVVALIGATGCSLDDDPMTVDAFCAEWANAECSAKAPVCFREVAECLPIRTAACMAFVAPLNQGARVFKEENANACLDKVRETYAKPVITGPDFDALGSVCLRVVEGTAVANAACVLDQDCVSPLICDKGVCGVRREIPPGLNCANPGEICSQDEHCQQNGPLFLCVANQELGAACGSGLPCKSTLFCAGTCMAKAAINAPCASNDACMSGFCNPYNAAGMPSTCLPGLNFGFGSAACNAFFGAAPAIADAGTD